MKDRGPRWVWLDTVHERVWTGKLSGTAEHVALVLGVYYMNGSCEAWPSLSKLATSSGMSRRTAWSAVHELEAQNLLRIDQKGKHNVYRILFP